MAELLFELGTEEIPSGYLNDALKELSRLAESYMKDHRIETEGSLIAHGTPRRLVLIAGSIAKKQADTIQEVTGPPKKAAYDEKGNPTKAALGFAKKQGVSVDELQSLETPKGEYLYIKRNIPGRPTSEILTEILPTLIADIPWPKSMRWGSGKFSFVRPIHWILALLDGAVIPFEVAGIKSGRATMGHRFMAPGKIEVEGLEDYLEKVSESSVVIDQKEREKRVAEAAKAAADTVSGTPLEDPGLVTTVANLVEAPIALCGGFDKAFLDLPDPVLITAMREHQKYFALRDQQGNLMPNFVAVNNTVPNDEAVVQKGHQRVLRARLADADFFFKEDRKHTLEDRLEDLKDVIYQAELGTSYSKVERFARLAEQIAEWVAPEKRSDAKLAARLCKCDLVTEMVMEFPSLQGVMGKEYARLDGHPEEVCLAIHEHYLPARADDALPKTVTGAIVGIADRMDTIAGSFSIGQEPTGAADPFALRRHALAIIRILEDRGWAIGLMELVSTSLGLLRETVKFDEKAVLNRLIDFFRERYRNLMLRAGYKTDLVEAVISADFNQISQLSPRIEQLQKFMAESDEFESIVLTSKRIKNILKKQEKTYSVDPSLFRESCESDLWAAFGKVKEGVEAFAEKNEYFEALNHMVQLRKPVDDIFEGVEILTKDDPKLKENRVGMLQSLGHLFLSLADFSKFSI